MTIKQQGGIFGRKPSFNTVETSASGNSITAERTGSDGHIVTLKKDGTDVGYLQSRAGVISELILDPRSAGGAGLAGSGEAITPMDHSQQANNHTSLGNDTYKWKNLYLSGNVIVASGQGIDFSATSGTGTSELFDDYEEGTWTPAIEIFGTPGTYTATTSGIYTKVGNLVTVTGNLTNVTESVAGGADYFKITGLPFTDIVGHSGAGSVNLTNWNVPACYNAYVTFDSTGARDFLIMGVNVDNGANVYLGKTHLVSGTSDINFTISYFT